MNPCPVCNETEGHAAECGYPDSLFGASEAFSDALRQLGRTVWAAISQRLERLERLARAVSRTG